MPKDGQAYLKSLRDDRCIYIDGRRVNDVTKDAAFAQATQAGLKETSPVQDMFWADRVGSVTDPFGVRWTLATHKRDVSPQEMEEARKKLAAKAA